MSAFKIARPISLTLSLGAALALSGAASAQYYTPPPGAVSQSHQPGGAGLDLGLRQGVYPSIGAGIGQVGAGAGAGFGRQGGGAGLAVGAGALGGTGTVGIGTNGLGTDATVGWGRQTGAALDAGVTRDGVGVGGRAELLGFGTGGSLGVGDRGPDLGASVAFGPLGTLQLGSHAWSQSPNLYPGAEVGYRNLQPLHGAPYYRARLYGNAPYYPPAQIMTCPVGWTCQ